MIDDFRELLTALNDESARFLVVGAHALAAHGVPRMTGDLDLWIEPTTANASRVWNALVRFGAPLETLGVQRQDFETPNQVIQMGLPPYRVDVLTTLSGVGFDEAWEGRLEGVIFDVPVAFLGRTAFVRNKRSTGRPKDLEDIRSLGE